MTTGIDFSRPVRDQLLAGWTSIFGNRMIGAYLYGSAVIGDFDPEISDLDMTVVLTSDATPQDLAELHKLHESAATAFPEWRGRIETQYISQTALDTFRTTRNRMINISPGEPIHFIETGIEWLTNWYFNRDHGFTLWGPPPDQVFPMISDEEFVQACRDHAMYWLERPGELAMSNEQSYAVLTLSRALYTHRHGVQVSKPRALRWIRESYPEFAELTDRAMLWRKQSPFSTPETHDQTVEFIRFVTSTIGSES